MSLTASSAIRDELAESARQRALGLIGRSLADCLAFRMLIRQVKWNLNGWSAFGLRRELKEIEADLRDYAALLVGRVVQLGRTAEEAVELGANRSGALERPPARSAGAQHEVCLPEVIAEFAEHMRDRIDELDRLEDAESAGLLAEAARVADTWLWRLDFSDCHRPALRFHSTAVGKSFLDAK